MSDSIKKFEEMNEEHPILRGYKLKRKHLQSLDGMNKDSINTTSAGNNLSFDYKMAENEELPPFKLPSEEELKESLDKRLNRLHEGGKKESENKVDYTELDWDFIDAMALRMKNESKYPKDNWKKPIDVIELIKPIMRHSRKIIQSIPGDKESNYDHLLAISLNAMMAAYQLKNYKQCS